MPACESFEGLDWVPGPFEPEPRWTIEPEIESIKQALQQFDQAKSAEIRFLAQGAFNKVYDAKIGDDSLIMRVTLPVDPRHKTLSEVATLDWVYRNTTLPVPKVITYQATRENLVGFEWMLMTKIPGNPLGDVWKSISFDAKVKLVEQIARFCADSFKHQLKGIGNIHDIPSAMESQKAAETQSQMPGQTESPLNAAPPKVGRIVSAQFLWGSHIHHDVPRGPFTSSKDWISAHLSFTERDCHETLAKYPEGGNTEDESDGIEDEIEHATKTLKIINKLKPLIPVIFPSTDQEPESTMIFSGDLSGQNILVNDSGVLTGVVDWECVSAAPLWKGCSIPMFLEARPRHSEPEIPVDGPSGCYWDDLKGYELTILRRKFLEEMRLQEPAWIDIYEKSQLQRDFDTAVNYCDDVYSAYHVNGWIDDVASGVGNIRSLDDRFYGF